MGVGYRPFISAFAVSRQIVLACLLTGAISLAQSPASNSTVPSQEENQPTTTIKVHVNQVLLRVVVRDHEGVAVGNLTREVFQVFDNGKPQPITSFSVTAAGSGEFAPKGGLAQAVKKELVEPQHYLAYVFDDLHVEQLDLIRVKKAALKYLNASLKPEDRAAIFTTSGRITQDFTDDKKLLEDTIDKIQPVQLLRGDSKCPLMNYYLADQIWNQNNQQLQDMLTEDTIRCKNLYPHDFFVPTAREMVRNEAQQELSIGDANVQTSLSVLGEIVQRMSTIPGQRSIVLASPGFFLVDTPKVAHVFDRALHANVVINSLDVRGLWVDPEISAQNSRTFAPTELPLSQYLHNAVLSQRYVLSQLADSTGGTLFENSNDLQEGFRRTSATPEFSYLLSFTPQDLKNDGKFHTLKVVITSPKGLSAHTQKGYFAPNGTENEAERAKNEIHDAVYSREERQDIPIEVHTQVSKIATDRARLTINTHLELGPLPFKKEDDRNRDTLNVVFALFDHNGHFVVGQEKTIEFDLTDDSLELELQTGVEIKPSFQVPVGEYLVRVVVRDTEGQLLSAKNDSVTVSRATEQVAASPNK